MEVPLLSKYNLCSTFICTSLNSSTTNQSEAKCCVSRTHKEGTSQREMLQITTLLLAKAFAFAEAMCATKIKKLCCCWSIINKGHKKIVPIMSLLSLSSLLKCARRNAMQESHKPQEAKLPI